MNINRPDNYRDVCGLQTVVLREQSRTADIRLKEILKRRASLTSFLLF